MKKRYIAALFALAAAVSLAAQTGGGGTASFSAEYVPTHFTGVTINEYGNLVGATRLIRSSSASIEETQVYGGLDGDGRVNTASELLAMASVLGIQDVKKEDALKLYTEIAMEGAINKFLGKTGTTHDEVLERLRGKYNFTDSQMAGAIRDTVAAVVDAEFNKTRRPPSEIQAIKDILAAFFISPNTTTFNAVRDVSFIYLAGTMTQSSERKKAYSDAGTVYDNTLRSLNPGLLASVYLDVYGLGGIDFKSGVTDIVALANLVRQYIK
jgi:hypothetical protein